MDVPVDDAGTGHRTSLLELELELDPGTWREVLATDLDGAFLCLQRAARRMVAAGRGGRIVDGGMLEMGPMAGSHLESDDWRRQGVRRPARLRW